MKTSEANKIKKEILAASDHAKAKICRDLCFDKYRNIQRYFSEELQTQFLALREKGDFEGAITFALDTMLPSIKKNRRGYEYDHILYSMSISSHVSGTPSPFHRLWVDDAITLKMIPALLKDLMTRFNKKEYILYTDDLLYLLVELSKRQELEAQVNLKYAIFHLIAKVLTSRKTIDYYKKSIDDTLLYLMEKYHIFNLEDPREVSLLDGSIRQYTFKPEWDQLMSTLVSPSKPRTTIQDLKKMMDEMDQRHADEVHYLFMSHYMDYSDYEFRDDWQIDAYHETYFAYFRYGDVDVRELNEHVLAILKEWQQDAYHKYQKAKKDLIWWITDPIPAFNPSLGAEISQAFESAILSDDEEEITKTLMPFPQKIAELIKSGQYEDAAANLYCMFEHLAAVEKQREEWFKSMWSGGDMTNIVCFTETLCELYCHLRQLDNLPVKLKDEMNIHLHILNSKTYFFGDMWADSRFEDMLHDGKKQFNDYSVLEECSIWKSWYLSLL